VATRIYASTPSDGKAVPVTPSSFSAGWNKTAGATDTPGFPFHYPSQTGGSVVNAASGTNGHFTCCARVVFPRLLAQTISGTVKGQFSCNEVAAGDNYTIAFALKVVKADGTDRGVLLAVSASDDTSTTPPEMATTSINRTLRDSAESASLSLSSLAVTAGDYLVLELGFRQASASSNNGTIVCNSDFTDLPEDETSSTAAGWIEFSGSVLFEPLYFKSASTPSDNGTGTADPTAVTPPTGMVAGDLACFIGQQRATGATLAITEAGGQTWTSEAAIGITNVTARLFWCVFDGTWDANPSIDFGATTCNSVQMHVFRPPSATYAWSVNQALAETEDATTPYTNPGQTTTGTAPTVSLVGWFTADDNLWDAAADAGWLSLGESQYRNTSGSDQSASYSHKVQVAAGDTGSVSKAQNTVTGDAATTFCITFAATNPLAAVLTGTLVPTVTETDIVNGGKTLIITLTGDTWKAAGTGPIGSTADTQALIDGIDSAQAEGTGWNAVVQPGIEVTDVARTSDTVATITLDAEGTYDITATETITATPPAAALNGGVAIVATPTFTVTAAGGAGTIHLLRPNNLDGTGGNRFLGNIVQ
jgi:hypothetical protein